MALFSPKCPSSSHFAPAQQRLNPSPVLSSRKWVSPKLSKKRQWRVVRVQEGSTVPVAPVKEIPVEKAGNGVLPAISSSEFLDATSKKGGESTVSITVVGASGDLAKKKIFPALFALYYEDCLPQHFTIFGYARSKMTDVELRTMVSKTLTCRIDKRENCSDKMEQFLKRCFYHSGQYDSEEHFAELHKKLKAHEHDVNTHTDDQDLSNAIDRNTNNHMDVDSKYSKEIPDAYERLLLDAIEGERRLFIRSDELDAAWELFTPLLKELEEKKIAPELYPYGSRGPVGAHYLAAKHNVRWGDLSAEHNKGL
ncbi:uncharacterized protein A4U43_C04F14890 [Asparagus officinalis]|uniref:Glucose-6-phosphate dehydrogenase NAD-binding domain-containing protein n=1 Tax=Asparagus officinalis TaxID=4686 RepID=A0A5P1F3N6_ASPOF|nr:uncharacterized protein A4U43_C04F14890 [Asparagus officinalis]